MKFKNGNPKTHLFQSTENRSQRNFSNTFENITNDWGAANEFPKLDLVRYEPHSPLRYWLSGGLKAWSLLPGVAFDAATAVDRALTRLHRNLGSFVTIELVRVP